MEITLARLLKNFADFRKNKIQQGVYKYNYALTVRQAETEAE